MAAWMVDMTQMNIAPFPGSSRSRCRQAGGGARVGENG